MGRALWDQLPSHCRYSSNTRSDQFCYISDYMLETTMSGCHTASLSNPFQSCIALLWRRGQFPLEGYCQWFMERFSSEIYYLNFWVWSSFLFLLFSLFICGNSVVLWHHSCKHEVLSGKQNLQLSLGAVLRRKWVGNAWILCWGVWFSENYWW